MPLDDDITRIRLSHAIASALRHTSYLSNDLTGALLTHANPEDLAYYRGRAEKQARDLIDALAGIGVAVEARTDA